MHVGKKRCRFGGVHPFENDFVGVKPERGVYTQKGFPCARTKNTRNPIERAPAPCRHSRAALRSTEAAYSLAESSDNSVTNMFRSAE
jgi:hypothetical protein